MFKLERVEQSYGGRVQMEDVLEVSQEVRLALNRNEAVVALESSVIAHGLPKEFRLIAARAMEDAVRDKGAVPAMVGVIGGKLKVGLSREEVEILAAGETEKVTVRDIPLAIARSLHGGTTVSATIRIAVPLGIVVMSTGGIGGVHLGDPYDVSVDLWEMTRTPAVVVCSGVKSIADARATLEWLETHGVPVYGYQSDELAGFYERSAGLNVPRLDSPEDLANVLRAAVASVGRHCATVVSVPVPEQHQIAVGEYVERALCEAREKGIAGKALTPFLLGRIAELTDGLATKANLALLANNARVAAEIAVVLSQESRRRMGFLV
ncbi:MAG: pseudouridine-5'-phosphate glycosidase [Armatimonadota bacterium]|nr:pseudouridine-5'-phosphate glycosidase [Armatimonadota bacterium]